MAAQCNKNALVVLESKFWCKYYWKPTPISSLNPSYPCRRMTKSPPELRNSDIASVTKPKGELARPCSTRQLSVSVSSHILGSAEGSNLASSLRYHYLLYCRMLNLEHARVRSHGITRAMETLASTYLAYPLGVSPRRLVLVFNQLRIEM